MMGANTFRAAFCGRFGFSLEAFEEELFWRCLPQRSAWLGKLFWRLDRTYFQPDMELIRSVADCTSCDDVQEEVGDFYYHQPIHGFWRKTLGIRLSGQQLVNLAGKLLG